MNRQMIRKYTERIGAAAAAIALSLSLLTGCSGAPQTGAELRFGGLKGPTSMGIVKLRADAEAGASEGAYTFTMAAAADELTPGFIRGELDIIAVPANLASMLWNNTDGSAEVIAVNTLGVLYIAEKGGETVNSISDLRGKTILATGKGTTPEYTLNYLLSESGLDPAADVDIIWKSEPSEVTAQMALEESAVAMLPQPFAAAASSRIEDLRIVLDLSELWDDIDNGSRLVTSVLLVRPDYAKEHPDAVSTFLKEYKESVEFVNSNVKEASVLIEKYGIVPAATAEKAIPLCNLVCITGGEMRSSLKGYLEILAEQDPASVGGKLPEEEFYFVEE